MTFAKKPPLIIIPGLGGRIKLYRLVVPIWRLVGYEPYIFSFGWEDADESFVAAIERLVDYVDNLHSTRVNIIGVSAGGTAAINALTLRPGMVQRVVTIATPYRLLPRLKNSKLRASINHLSWDDINKSGSRILSIHGLYDQTVPVGASRPKGAKTRKIHVVSHGVIIVAALTLYCGAIGRFIKK